MYMSQLFGERVRELRLERRLSRRQLAEKFHLKQNAVYEWETRGKQTDYETLCKLADFFDVTTDYLLGRTDI
ncbi:hypothetical protein FACS1894211_09860 [Clostridia bacterium]|nr:hypothetical protein FACS1894211_09860 [Clostridia bacterium]